MISMHNPWQKIVSNWDNKRWTKNGRFTSTMSLVNSWVMLLTCDHGTLADVCWLVLVWQSIFVSHVRGITSSLRRLFICFSIQYSVILTRALNVTYVTQGCTLQTEKVSDFSAQNCRQYVEQIHIHRSEFSANIRCKKYITVQKSTGKLYDDLRTCACTS